MSKGYKFGQMKLEKVNLKQKSASKKQQQIKNSNEHKISLEVLAEDTDDNIVQTLHFYIKTKDSKL